MRDDLSRRELPRPFLYAVKLMGIFVNIDRTMGKHFEAGLQNLQPAVKNEP
jgi:hypothetical protein